MGKWFGVIHMKFFVADGHMDKAIINVYKNEQKKSNFKDERLVQNSYLHATVDKACKINIIQMRSNYYNSTQCCLFIRGNQKGGSRRSTVYLTGNPSNIGCAFFPSLILLLALNKESFLWVPYPVKLEGHYFHACLLISYSLVRPSVSGY